MAKTLLLLETAEPVQLETALADRLAQHFPGDRQVAVSLMRAVAEDHLHDPGSRHGRPQVVLELVAAPGLPTSALVDSLRECLAGVPVAQSSIVLHMDERVFISGEPQPIHYHYLMVKRAEFSAADYRDYYVNYHHRMAFNTPAISTYAQNYVDPQGSARIAAALGLDTREVTSVSELTMASLEAFVGHPDLAAVGGPAAEDEARFVDRDDSVSFCSEVVLRLGDREVVREAVFEQHFPPAL